MTPDAVFSDINLPDGDGVNFCMSTALRFPATLWLLMSGNDDLLRLGSQLKSIGGDKPISRSSKSPCRCACWTDSSAASAAPPHPNPLRVKPVSRSSRLKGRST